MKERNKADNTALTVKGLLPVFGNQHSVASSITNRM